MTMLNMTVMSNAFQEIKAFKGVTILEKAIKELAHDAKIAVQDFFTIHFDYDITKESLDHIKNVKQIFKKEIELNSNEAIEALFIEIVAGNTHLVKRLIEKGINPNKVQNDRSLLSHALENNHMRLAFKLVKLGANPTPEEKIQMLQKLARQTSFKPEHFSRIINRDNINNSVNEANETLLHVALKTGGNEASIKLLIKNGANVNKTNAMDMAPLNIATQARDFSSSLNYVKLLIEDGHATLKTSSPLISFELIRDHLNIANYLLEKGADINSQDPFRKTLLHQAIGAKNQTVVEYLLNKGINVNLADSEGQTPLQLAIVNSQLEIALKLVDNGATINSLSPLQQVDLLKTAITKNQTDTATLIVASIDLNATDTKGNTLLHEAAKESGNEKLIEFLIGKEAYVNQKNNDGMTPLNYAALYSSLDSVKLLVEKGNANLNTSFPMISLELIRSHQEIATYLFGKGADINSQDKDGNTLLHLAAKNKSDKNALEFLMAKGANVNIANKEGETPLEIAIINQNATHARSLLKHQANPNPSGRNLLHKAIETQSIHVIAALLDNKGDLHEPNGEGKTPIDLAIELESSTIIDYLMENYNHQMKESTSSIVTALVAGKKALAQQFETLGATLNKQSAFFSLQHAIINNQMDTARLLIEYGVDINTSIGETTLLHQAIENEDVKTTKNLIQLGANVALQDSEGNSPLHLSARSGNKALLSAVISKENLNLTNKKGQTALNIAIKSQDLAFKQFATAQIGVFARSKTTV